VEGSIYNACGLLQTNCYVLWDNKLASNIPGNDKQNSKRLKKVVAFVDDILVGTETKEGHDKIVEKVLRRLEENNLYIKPEKCM